MSHPFTNEELILGIVQNNEEIIRFLYSDTFPKVRWLIIKNSGTEDDAKDIFQDAILILYQKLKEEDLTLYCAVPTYLYSICKYMWLKELARKQKMNYASVEEIEYVWLGENESGEDKSRGELEWGKLYFSLFKELSKECKKILNLHFRRYKIEEITRLLGYPSDQYTMDRKYRCKQNLIKRIIAHPQFKKYNEGR